MKTSLAASYAVAALLLSSCSNQKADNGGGGRAATSAVNGPTSEEVDAYMEENLPAFLDVNGLKSENFIDANTKEGRVSVSATLRFNEGVYRDATDAEILDYLQQHGISRSERQLYVPFNQFQSINMEHRFLSVITGPQTEYPITTELMVKKTVNGWSLYDGGNLARGSGFGGIDPALMAGKPLKNFGSGALPFGSPQAEAYLNEAVQRKQATNSGEDTLLANVRALFTPGKSIIIHMMKPQSKKRDDITFTPEGDLSVSPDGKSTFTVVGAIQHSNPASAPYQTENEVKAQIAGQLEHRQGSLAANYVVTLGFYNPRSNQYIPHSMISRAVIIDKRILSSNGMYNSNWWTD